MFIDKDIEQFAERAVQHRRWFHQHPEIGFEVQDTRDYILRHLKDLAFDEVKILAGTGIKAVMRAKEAQKTVAFRADMDALSIREETGVEYASTTEGYMHACGHDGHMTMLLCFAEWLHHHKQTLTQNVVLIFQPAEESEGGAVPMVREGVLMDPPVDCIFAFHILPDIPQGKIGLSAGPIMAQTCEFDVALYGKSAHGAMPHRGIDGIYAAAHFIQSLQGILTRRVDPFEKALLSIGRLEGGERRNILASKVTMEGIIRTFNDDVYQTIKSHILGLLESMEKSHGVSGEFTEVVYYPAVVNDEALTRRIEGILSDNTTISIQPMMIAEDFSFYQQQVPGVFMFLGSGNEALGFIHGLHSSQFNFDEEILLQGMQVFKHILQRIYK